MKNYSFIYSTHINKKIVPFEITTRRIQEIDIDKIDQNYEQEWYKKEKNVL